MNITPEQEATIRELSKHEWFHELLCITWAAMRWTALAWLIITDRSGWLIFFALLLCFFSSWKTPLNKYMDQIGASK